MLWAAPFVLAGLTATAPVAPASTYDQAACDEESAPPVVEPGKCLPVDPVVVIDCDDPGMTPWVAEMIGSCDMPRPLVPGLKPDTLKPARGVWMVRSGIDGGHHQTPVRTGGGNDDQVPALGAAIHLRVVLAQSLTPEHVLAPLRSGLPQRLERPPRV